MRPALLGTTAILTVYTMGAITAAWTTDKMHVGRRSSIWEQPALPAQPDNHDPEPSPDPAVSFAPGPTTTSSTTVVTVANTSSVY